MENPILPVILSSQYGWLSTSPTIICLPVWKIFLCQMEERSHLQGLKQIEYLTQDMEVVRDIKRIILRLSQALDVGQRPRTCRVLIRKHILSKTTAHSVAYSSTRPTDLSNELSKLSYGLPGMISSGRGTYLRSTSDEACH